MPVIILNDLLLLIYPAKRSSYNSNLLQGYPGQRYYGGNEFIDMSGER
jgi:glycine/serine hydroxymethyltransferase